MFLLIRQKILKCSFLAGENGELIEYLSKQSEMLHTYVSNLDGVLEALDVHENSITVLTVLGVKANAQKPTDIPGDQYHTAIATQINDFVAAVSEEELRVLAEPCKIFPSANNRLYTYF